MKKTGILPAVLCSIQLRSQTVATIGPEKGSLIIIGGGNVGPGIWSKFDRYILCVQLRYRPDQRETQNSRIFQ
ncbi:MAG: hypothetical protein ABI581_08060 [Sediminibacterium sp.]